MSGKKDQISGISNPNLTLCWAGNTYYVLPETCKETYRGNIDGPHGVH